MPVQSTLSISYYGLRSFMEPGIFQCRLHSLMAPNP